MMHIQQKGLLTLIKSAITGERYPLPEGFDLLEEFPEIQKHRVSTLAYYGAINCGYDPNELYMQQMFGACYIQVAKSEKQLLELDRLLQTFEDQGIDALPLKGTVMKRLYPKPEMRRMGDADILIREEQLSMIKPIMEAAGYKFVKDANHEIAWKKPTLFVELHRMMIPAYHKHYHAYFGTGWDRAIPTRQGSHLYTMSPEDTLVFIFAHFTKHYMAGGIGLLHMTDLWVYSCQNPELDQGYIKGELKKLGFDRFYENVMRTLQTWFADVPADAVTETITQHIFSSGIYGTYENNTVAGIARETRNNQGKRPSIFKRLAATAFPSREALQTYGYPILRKWPILLPFVWVARWFRLIFVHRDRIKRKIKDFRDTSAQNVEAYEKKLEFVGIRFLNKE